MIFADGGGAVWSGPSGERGHRPDTDYASGRREVTDHLADPEFDNSITVYGPQVRAGGRYLTRMMQELSEARAPRIPRARLDTIDLVVRPDQWSRSWGRRGARTVFQHPQVGNTSAPVYHRGVGRRGRRGDPAAGANFAPALVPERSRVRVMRIDPRIVAHEQAGEPALLSARGARTRLIERGCAGGVRG